MVLIKSLKHVQILKIVEELQFLKLEAEDKDDIKFKDWNRNDEYDLMILRLL